MKCKIGFIGLLVYAVLVVQTVTASAEKTNISLTNALRFSPDGKRLISAGLIGDGTSEITRYGIRVNEKLDKRLRVWDVKSGREIHRLPAEPMTGSRYAPRSVLLLTDFETMLTAWGGYKIKSVDVHSFHFHKSIDVGNGAIFSLALSPNRKILAIGATRVVEFRDSRTYRLLRTYQHGSQGTNVYFGPDSQTAVCFWYGSKPQAVDVATARQVRYPRWVYRVQDADTFAFAADGKTLAKAKGKTIEIWTTPVNDGGLKIATFSTNFSSVRTLQFSPDGKVLAVGGASVTTIPVEFISLSATAN